MREVKIFSTVEEVYQILGRECPEKYWEDSFYDSLWDAGFNFDDWDIGFCCKEPFTFTEHENDDGTGEEWEEAYHAGVFTEFMEQRAGGHTAMDGKMYHRGLLVEVCTLTGKMNLLIG